MRTVNHAQSLFGVHFALHLFASSMLHIAIVVRGFWLRQRKWQMCKRVLIRTRQTLVPIPKTEKFIRKTNSQTCTSRHLLAKLQCKKCESSSLICFFFLSFFSLSLSHILIFSIFEKRIFCGVYVNR